MHANAFILALAATASAHGVTRMLTGDLGGGSLGLTQKAATPAKGKNSVTEVDTVVFKNTNAKSNGLGKTTNNGQIKPEQISKLTAAALTEAGSTQVPQVADAGTLNGVWRTIVTDGGGPIFAVVDPTATGQFAQGIEAEIINQPPGIKGNVNKQNQAVGKRSVFEARGLFRRGAVNVGAETKFQVKLPAGIQCTGQVQGVEGPACLMKIANNNKAGPFGDLHVIQIGAANPGAGIGNGAGNGAGNDGGNSTVGAGKSTGSGKSTGGTTTGTTAYKLV